MPSCMWANEKRMSRGRQEWFGPAGRQVLSRDEAWEELEKLLDEYCQFNEGIHVVNPVNWRIQVDHKPDDPAPVSVNVTPFSSVAEERRARKAALGRDLRAIRARIVASGAPLLNWDEIEAEKARARNFQTGNDKNLP